MRVEQIGDCRLILGDCLSVLPTLEKVDAVIADPPYEQQAHTPMRRTRSVIEGRESVSGLGFSMVTEEQREFISSWCSMNCKGWVILFCQVEAVSKWADRLEAMGCRYDRAWCWVKPDAAPRFNGQGPAQGYESIVTGYCPKSGAKRWNGGGIRNVLTFNSTHGRESDHPTEKPVVLMARLASLYTHEGDTILDPFMGSGTTGVACVELGRKFIGVEIDPKYFDISCRRIEQAVKRQDCKLPGFGVAKVKPVQSGLW